MREDQVTLPASLDRFEKFGLIEAEAFGHGFAEQDQMRERHQSDARRAPTARHRVEAVSLARLTCPTRIEIEAVNLGAKQPGLDSDQIRQRRALADHSPVGAV